MVEQTEHEREVKSPKMVRELFWPCENKDHDRCTGRIERSEITGVTLECTCDCHLIAAVQQRCVETHEQLRTLLQAVVDCYGLGQPPEKFVEQVGGFIEEGRELLATLAAAKEQQ